MRAVFVNDIITMFSVEVKFVEDKPRYYIYINIQKFYKSIQSVI